MGIIARGGSSPPSRTISIPRCLRALVLGPLVGLLLVGCQGPVAVVESAVDAARRGDRDAYEACFTQRSRPMLRALWRAAGDGNHGSSLGAGVVTTGAPTMLQPGQDWQPRVMVPVSEGAQRLGLVLHSEALTWRIDLVDTEGALTGIRSPF